MPPLARPRPAASDAEATSFPATPTNQLAQALSSAQILLDQKSAELNRLDAQIRQLAESNEPAMRAASQRVAERRAEQAAELEQLKGLGSLLAKAVDGFGAREQTSARALADKEAALKEAEALYKEEKMLLFRELQSLRTDHEPLRKEAERLRAEARTVDSRVAALEKSGQEAEARQVKAKEQVLHIESSMLDQHRMLDALREREHELLEALKGRDSSIEQLSKLVEVLGGSAGAGAESPFEEADPSDLRGLMTELGERAPATPESATLRVERPAVATPDRRKEPTGKPPEAKKKTDHEMAPSRPPPITPIPGTIAISANMLEELMLDEAPAPAKPRPETTPAKSSESPPRALLQKKAGATAAAPAKKQETPTRKQDPAFDPLSLINTGTINITEDLLSDLAGDLDFTRNTETSK